ncbi:glucose PTS transporter subunit EIIB [Collinsella aerofaciens]|uniref:glucose PTS transporter subunit EIIB n=1 Tax=Collinsella aerofaciens TaxID=74426 RepID=UPI0034A12EA4
MDYRKSAQEVLDNIGGADNVISAAHCATRLRLVIADNAKVDKEALENIDGAKGVFEAQGQLQIIFGTGTVNKVYDEFIALGGINAASKAEVKEAAAQQQNIFMRAIKVFGDVFVPIIPAIVASGLLLGIMSASTLWPPTALSRSTPITLFIRLPIWSRERPLAFCRS